MVSLSEVLPFLQGTREGKVVVMFGSGQDGVGVEGWQSGPEEEGRDNRPALLPPAPRLDAWGSLHSSGLTHSGIPLGPRCNPGQPLGHAWEQSLAWLSRPLTELPGLTILLNGPFFLLGSHMLGDPS